MKILFIASNGWAKYLETQIKSSCLNVSSENVISLLARDILSFKGLVNLFTSSVIVRVGLPPSMPRFNNIIIDALLFPFEFFLRKKRFIYWIGSDVLMATQVLSSRLSFWTQSYLRMYSSIAAAPWLSEELASLGISSSSFLFPYSIKIHHKCISVSDPDFKISVYLPESKQEFYGGQLIADLAESFPFLQIHVYGSNDFSPSIKNMGIRNIFFHGWVDNPLEIIQQCQVHIRYVSHDALGGSVRDALASACHVIYTYDVPYVNAVEYGDIEGIYKLITNLYSEYSAGRLSPNYEGQSWAQINLNSSQLSQQLFDFLSCDL